MPHIFKPSDPEVPCTRQLNRAIEKAVKEGGGRLIIPPGRYVTGTVFLRSNLTLELAAGAVLVASDDIAEYPELPLNAGFPVHLRKGDLMQRRHLLVAEDAEHVTICGTGVIDGNMEAFAPGWKDRPPFTWRGPSSRFFVPTLEFLNCRNLRLRDFTVCNSPGWTCHLCRCDEVRVEGVTLLNDLYAGNSDGFDVDGCRDVWFTGCRIETGDDCIVMKSNPLTRSCERIIITNCILRSTCAAVKIGTESWHDFRDIRFSNSIVHGSNRAFQITCLDGATVEDIIVEGLSVDTNSTNIFNRPIHLDLAKRRKGFIKGSEGQHRLGRIRRVAFSNLNIKTDGRLLFTAGDGARLEDISLNDVRLIYPWIEDPETLGDADLLQGSASCPEARGAKAAIVAQNIDRLQVRNLSIRWPSEPPQGGLLPKYQDGKSVRDPCREFHPMPNFAPFQGIGLREEQLHLNGVEDFLWGADPSPAEA
jgi:hypothetical protein